jgi:toxin ParE1/3/4
MKNGAYALILSEEARQDEIESYLYYEIQRSGLGEEFLKALEKSYTALRNNPFSYSFIDKICWQSFRI